MDVHGFALEAIDRGVVTQVLGAAGVGEGAFNGGLMRGFGYGERHSAHQLRSARQRAFAALASAGHSIGSERGFEYDDVYTLAAVLLPTADAVVTEGDRRRELRLENEQAARREKLGLAGPGRGPWRPL